MQTIYIAISILNWIKPENSTRYKFSFHSETDEVRS